MKRLEMVLPAAMVVYGGYVMWDALFKMTYYNHDRGAPGPGFLPFWLSVGLVVLGAALTVRALRANGAAGAAQALPDDVRRRLWLVLGAVVGALLVFERLGYILTTMSFMAVVSFGLGLRSWKVLLAVSVGVAIGSYALFASLGVELPKGIVAL